MGNEEINQFDKEGNSALYRAVKNNDSPLVSKLLRLGATQTVNKTSENPLMCAVGQAKPNLLIIKLLLKKIEAKDLELINSEGKNLLHLVCETGNVELLMELLNNEKYRKGICQSQILMKDNKGKVPIDYTTNDKIVSVLEGLEFVEGHDRLIKCLEDLGYQFDNEGICFGLAHMGMQAILSNEIDVFNKRLNLLMKYESSELIVKISEAREKYAQYTKSLIAEIDHAENEKQITKEQRIAYEDEWLNINAAQKAEMLTKEECILLEIPPFIEGLLVYFQPSLYPELFESTIKTKEETRSFVQDAMLSAPLVLSKEIENQGGLQKLMSFSGMYDPSELVSYFKSLEDSLDNQESLCKHPLVLTLCNIFHAISIGYDSTNEKKWVFIDANHMPASYYSSAEEIAAKIQEAFFADKSEKVTFKTDMFVTKVNSSEVSPIVDAWKNTREWQSMHAVSLEKAMSYDSVNTTWLAMAAKSGHVGKVKELLKVKELNRGFEFCLMDDLPDNGPAPSKLYLAKNGEYVVRDRHGKEYEGSLSHTNIDMNDLENKLNDSEFKNAVLGYTSNRGITRMVLNEALISAAEWGHIEVVVALLNEGIDPNMDCGTDVTPLLIAAQNGHVKVVEALLKAEGINPNQVNKNGKTALSIAKEKGFEQVVMALEKNEKELKQSETANLPSAPEYRKKGLVYNSYKTPSEDRVLTENRMNNKLEDMKHAKDKKTPGSKGFAK